MKVHTNDPAQPLIGLELVGQVNAFVLLTPAIIELSGKPGQAITSKMTITPADPKMDFKIDQAAARDSRNIRFEIKRNDQATPARYELIVENIKKEPGRYVDLITIWTDTSRKIPIRVFGNITQ
ncbi:MAG: hypothetical protein A2277_13835 [Desulfobacterales bacterium RIFOXYA12_FULL_46_15]|nr:MAG: hypothetical protein A2097_02200 [Desulfobacula sp. GWF2_41_7]OGR23377.1 MAG: hypothetical protein A2277_13835 [Desulfobacterales bacterium RIFOXYA12_FULL_46_15]